jgi:ABC-2 type transport system ATP-binding protein
MGLPYEIKDEKHAVIYEEFKISELVSNLSASGCELLTVHEVDESLETYFLELTGGEDNA